MNRKQKLGLLLLIALNAVFVLTVLHLVGVINIHLKWAFFNPQGVIASQERRLFVTVFLIMFAVAVPMLTAIFWFAYKYRATNVQNTEADYAPEWNFNPWIQFFCWAIPVTVITIVGVMNWRSTHALDPYNPIPSDKPPITIEVVALQWKWLFIYPEQHIATVNFLEFPEKTPLKFDLTADAPMNSFWIPQLGSQIYEMPGMETHLNLIADQAGDFNGSSAEISGAGFSNMNFIARAATQQDFNAWVASVKQSGNLLDSKEYAKLVLPGTLDAPQDYSAVQNGLFNAIMQKYMAPSNQMHMNMENVQ